jgi:hypothetical protein
MTTFLVLIGAINIACWAIQIVCWFWKSRNWKPSPFLMPYGMPPESKRSTTGHKND